MMRMCFRNSIFVLGMSSTFWASKEKKIAEEKHLNNDCRMWFALFSGESFKPTFSCCMKIAA